MKAYWYAKSQAGVVEINNFWELVGFFSPVPVNAQVWVPSRVLTGEEWFRINAINRIVPVQREACNELRTTLLLQGIPCP